MKFKVGDRVRHINPSSRFKGLGTIIKVFHTGTFAVRWDQQNPEFLHSCRGLCEDGHGSYMSEFVLTSPSMENV